MVTLCDCKSSALMNGLLKLMGTKEFKRGIGSLN